jgi:hypothetical protein
MNSSWCLWSDLFVKDLAMDHIAWDVASYLTIFISHRTSAFLRIILLTVFATHLTVVLHAGSLVSCHSFHNLSSACVWINQEHLCLVPKGCVIVNLLPQIEHLEWSSIIPSNHALSVVCDRKRPHSRKPISPKISCHLEAEALSTNS